MGGRPGEKMGIHGLESSNRKDRIFLPFLCVSHLEVLGLLLALCSSIISDRAGGRQMGHWVIKHWCAMQGPFLLYYLSSIGEIKTGFSFVLIQHSHRMTLFILITFLI